MILMAGLLHEKTVFGQDTKSHWKHVSAFVLKNIFHPRKFCKLG